MADRTWSDYTEGTEPLDALGGEAFFMLNRADIGFDRKDTELQLQRIGQQVTELGEALRVGDEEAEFHQIADIIITTCVLAVMRGMVPDLLVEKRWAEVRAQYSYPKKNPYCEFCAEPLADHTPTELASCRADLS